MRTTYTNNMFHFEQTTVFGGYIDTYVKADSDLGEKVIKMIEHHRKSMVAWNERFGQEVVAVRDDDPHMYPAIKEVKGTKYLFYDYATNIVSDVQPLNIRKSLTRLVKEINRLYEEMTEQETEE